MFKVYMKVAQKSAAITAADGAEGGGIMDDFEELLKIVAETLTVSGLDANNTDLIKRQAAVKTLNVKCPLSLYNP